MKLIRIFSLIGVLLVGFAITVWFVHHSDVPSASGAFQSSGEASWQSVALTAAYGFAVTLVGVALGAAYRRLVKLRTAGTDKIAPLKLTGDVITSVDFQIGLVGAPIVYGLLWQSISDIHLAGLTVIALQNGFTSHAILNQLMTEKPSANSLRAEK
jgi:hypothetical protein